MVSSVINNNCEPASIIRRKEEEEEEGTVCMVWCYIDTVDGRVVKVTTEHTHTQLDRAKVEHCVCVCVSLVNYDNLVLHSHLHRMWWSSECCWWKGCALNVDTDNVGDHRDPSRTTTTTKPTTTHVNDFATKLCQRPAAHSCTASDCAGTSLTNAIRTKEV